MIVELTPEQLLGLAALAVAAGVLLGISIGIEIYSRFGRAA